MQNGAPLGLGQRKTLENPRTRKRYERSTSPGVVLKIAEDPFYKNESADSFRISNLPITLLQKHIGQVVTVTNIKSTRFNKKLNTVTMKINDKSEKTKDTLKKIKKNSDLSVKIGDKKMKLTVYPRTFRKVIYITPKENNMDDLKEDLVQRNGDIVHKCTRLGSTYAVLLSMAYNATGTISTAYGEKSLSEYIPTTRLCYKCQKPGHDISHSNSDIVCGKCATKGHWARDCSLESIKCTLCNGNHKNVQCDILKNQNAERKIQIKSNEIKEKKKEYGK